MRMMGSVPELERMEQNEMDEPQMLLRPAEAARLVAKSRTWAYEAMASGLLSYVLVGGSRRIPRSALLDFIDGLQRQESAR